MNDCDRIYTRQAVEAAAFSGAEAYQLAEALRAAMRYIAKLEADNARLKKLNNLAGEILAERIGAIK